jgi:hypothetical protein
MPFHLEFICGRDQIWRTARSEPAAELSEARAAGEHRRETDDRSAFIRRVRFFRAANAIEKRRSALRESNRGIADASNTAGDRISSSTPQHFAWA